jgi:hypothetical protein
MRSGSEEGAAAKFWWGRAVGLAMSLSGVLIGRMPYRANEGGALISRGMKLYKRDKVKKYIREFTSPARYSILFIPKPDGKLWLYVDYRRLNEITVKNRYTLSLIHKMQDRIKRAKWFTKLNLKNEYYRIRIKKSDKWKTAFGSQLRHYKYLIMLFELTNTLALYQNLINNIFRKYLDDFIIVYLDDILIYSKTKKEHIRHVTVILKALEKTDIRINGAKSVFHV